MILLPWQENKLLALRKEIKITYPKNSSNLFIEPDVSQVTDCFFMLGTQA